MFKSCAKLRRARGGDGGGRRGRSGRRGVAAAAALLALTVAGCGGGGWVSRVDQSVLYRPNQAYAIGAGGAPTEVYGLSPEDADEMLSHARLPHWAGKGLRRVEPGANTQRYIVMVDPPAMPVGKGACGKVKPYDAGEQIARRSIYALLCYSDEYAAQGAISLSPETAASPAAMGGALSELLIAMLPPVDTETRNDDSSWPH